MSTPRDLERRHQPVHTECARPDSASMVHEAEGPRPVWIVPAPQVGLLLPLPRTAETQMVEKGTLLDCWMTVLAGNLSLNSRTDECRQWVESSL